MKPVSVAVVTACLTAALACGERAERHDHSAAHPQGHDHHEPGHGHGDAPMVLHTLWGGGFELFAEHEAPVLGREVSVLLHVTALDGFRPLEAATLTLDFDGPAALSGHTATALRPGIYRIALTPTRVGSYRGRLTIAGDRSGVVEGFGFDVAKVGGSRPHDDHHDHDHDGEHRDGESEDDHSDDEQHDEWVEFLKEQQWGVPFATAFVVRGQVVETIEVAGRIDTPPGGRASVGAPVSGRLVAPAAGFARPGDKVAAGDVLASLVPAPSSPEAIARASLAVAEADARASSARAAAERAERLFRDEAIALSDLENARREAAVAEEAVAAAQGAAALYGAGTAAEGAWPLVAPIDGVLNTVAATPGASVTAGETLFSIVDARVLWIVAEVPEQDAARLRTDADAAFQVAGLEAWRDLVVSGAKAGTKGGDSLVSVARTVDATTRTVRVIYELGAADPALRVGGLVRVALPVGEAFDGIVVPRSALVDEAGRDIVYVQRDGEHFEERVVRIGPRSASLVAVEAGLREGERVVTRGAHLLRLADRASNVQPHGHIH